MNRSDTVAAMTENTTNLMTVVRACRRCGSVDWNHETLTCRGCGLTSYANSSRRRFKLTIHHRRSTWNRRKALHGRQIKRSVSTL